LPNGSHARFVFIHAIALEIDLALAVDIDDRRPDNLADHLCDRIRIRPKACCRGKMRQQKVDEFPRPLQKLRLVCHEALEYM